MVPILSSLLILTDCKATRCWAIFLKVKWHVLISKLSISVTNSNQQLNEEMSKYLVRKNNVFFLTSQERAPTR